MSTNNATQTFWNLIQNYYIIIPKLQRDYAQGRPNDQAIEQIRNSLIDEIYNALVKGGFLELNFIYGSIGDCKFIPIDGQQRLTTLFLLHWYVFSRSDYKNGLEILKNFSYETRDTSSRFCKNICNLHIEFDKKTISEQIKECYWLTGNFEMDPTIQSMLVMIDALHSRFIEYTDYETLKNRLIASDCHITFLWLEMPNFQQTNDLYIKMNARGKLLSDFEIFKAKLQGSEVLEGLLGKNVSEKDRIVFISKYNNEYAEFFYKLFDSEYDNALMDFIKEMVRDTYLRNVSEGGVPQKTYRSNYRIIRAMPGSVLFRYIENGGTKYDQNIDADSAFIEALKRTDKLLELFSNMTSPLVFENKLSKDYYNEKELFIKNHDKENLEEDVVRYALYSFLYKFGIPSTEPEKQAYSMWKRIVYNLVKNSTFEARREDICEAFVFIEKIITQILTCCEKSVLEALTNIDSRNCTAAIRFQLQEEIIKANLIMNDQAWRSEILDAESYFIDGQIGFALEYCESKGFYDINIFRKYYDCIKSVLDETKKLKVEIDSAKFEQALLCMNDQTSNHTAHLEKQANSTTSWGFVRSNYQVLLKNNTDPQKKNIFQELIKKIIDSSDINTKICEIIEGTDLSILANEEKWKIPFIKNALFDVPIGDYKFKNCINLDKNNTEILLMSSTTVRSKSMELNTFLLYQELKQYQPNLKLSLYATCVIKDQEGFPTRFIEINNVKIGYDGTDSKKPYVWKDDNSQLKLSKTEVIGKVKKL